MFGIQVPAFWLGIMLLVLGQSLFWLFAGIIGFLTGMGLTAKLFPECSEMVLLVIGVGLGFLGAMLAVWFQRLTIIAAGFLGGAYLLASFFPMDFYAGFFIGGIIGALLAAFVIDWAVIILSSLLGAVLISRSLLAADTPRTFMFIALAVFGVMVQSAIFLRKPAKR